MLPYGVCTQYGLKKKTTRFSRRSPVIIVLSTDATVIIDIPKRYPLDAWFVNAYGHNDRTSESLRSFDRDSLTPLPSSLE